MAQIREDLAAERELSVRRAVEQERARWEARLEQELKQTRLRSEAERQVSLAALDTHIIKSRPSEIFNKHAVQNQSQNMKKVHSWLT